MNSPDPPTQNRRTRVFVSSPFRDMKGVRYELRTHAWPELRRFCRERQVELVEVDLRWGIGEEQSTRKETLKLCLGEIIACRPLFIGLLGERYDWVPEPQPIGDQAGRQVYAALSITEREIQHAVRNQPSDGCDSTSEIVLRMERTTA